MGYPNRVLREKNGPGESAQTFLSDPSLLEHYCPAYGACQSVALWGSIAAFSVTSPLVLLVAYRWVTSYTPGPTGQVTHGLVIDLGGLNGDRGQDTHIYDSPSSTPRSDSVKLKSFAFGSGHRRQGSISEGAHGTPRGIALDDS